MYAKTVDQQQEHPVIYKSGQTRYQVVSENPCPERYMGISFSERPKVVQGEVAQDGYLNGNGRCNFKPDIKVAGKNKQKAHVHQDSRSSHKGKLYKFFQPAPFNIYAFQNHFFMQNVKLELFPAHSTAARMKADALLSVFYISRWDGFLIIMC